MNNNFLRFFLSPTPPANTSPRFLLLGTLLCHKTILSQCLCSALSHLARVCLRGPLWLWTVCVCVEAQRNLFRPLMSAICANWVSCAKAHPATLQDALPQSPARKWAYLIASYPQAGRMGLICNRLYLSASSPACSRVQVQGDHREHCNPILAS